MRKLFIAITCAILAACSADESGDNSHNAKNRIATHHVHYTCKTIPVEGGWGYEIYADEQVYVRQEHIPAISGIHPFASEEDAWKVGDMAIQKIVQGIVPPTVSIEEMITIGITLPPQN